MADNEAKVNDGIVQLEEGRQELLDNQKKLEDGEAELAESEPKLAEARKKLEDGQAEYEAGLKQYQDALAQIEAGEQQLAAGKAELERQEEFYRDGLENMADEITDMLQSQYQDMQIEVTAENIQDYVDWFDEKGYDAPQSYEELLAYTDEYLKENYPGITLPLVPAYQEIQAGAKEMLDILSSGTGGGQAGTTEPEDGEGTEPTVVSQAVTMESEAGAGMATTDETDASPAEQTGEGVSRESEPSENVEETEPENGQEETAQGEEEFGEHPAEESTAVDALADAENSLTGTGSGTVHMV